VPVSVFTHAPVSEAAHHMTDHVVFNARLGAPIIVFHATDHTDLVVARATRGSSVIGVASALRVAPRGLVLNHVNARSLLVLSTTHSLKYHGIFLTVDDRYSLLDVATHEIVSHSADLVPDTVFLIVSVAVSAQAETPPLIISNHFIDIAVRYHIFIKILIKFYSN